MKASKENKMIKINTIDHINMSVSNLESSLKFYEEMFGFEVKEKSLYKNQKHAITGVSDKVMLALYESKQLPELGRIRHFGINIENFDEVLNIINQKKIKTYFGDESQGGAVIYKNSRSVYIHDPDGNEIELTEKVGGGL